MSMSSFDRVFFWRRPSFQLVAWVLAVVTPLAALGQAIQNDGNDQIPENDKSVRKGPNEKFGNVQKFEGESSLPNRPQKLEGLEGQISPAQAPEKSALIEPSQLSRSAEPNQRLAPQTDNWTRFYNAGLKSSQMRRYED